MVTSLMTKKQVTICINFGSKLRINVPTVHRYIHINIYTGVKEAVLLWSGN